MKKFLRKLFRRDSLDDELQEEMQFHLDARAKLNQQSGMSAEDAQESAQRTFGNRTLLQEDTRRMHINQYLEAIGQDLRYAFRSFRRNPAFTLTAVFTIALGIGSTTAVFSVVDRVLFRSLPYPNDERLVSVGILAPQFDNQEFLLGSTYLQWRDVQTPFESFTSWLPGVVNCDLTDQNPVRLGSARVESTFLSTFGIQPILGRNFTREEDQPNTPKVALLAYPLWKLRFGSDPGIVGKTISLDGQSALVIGVLPASFEMPTLNKVDLVVPQALDEKQARLPNSLMAVRAFARLKPDISVTQAKAQLEPAFRQSLNNIPAPFRKGIELRLRSLRDRQVQDVKLASWVLFGAVIAVLLIACANVANLLLARSASRQRELAVRVAIGAGRGRLIRQNLTESLVLSLMGGALGCAIAYSLLRVFVAIAPAGIVRLEQATLDYRVLLFAIAVSLGSGILFGLAPSLQNPRAQTLTGWRATGAPRGLFRQILVAAQIATSLVLLTGASLLLRSLWNLQNEPLGMQTDSVVNTMISLGQQRYAKPMQQLSFWEALETRVRALPFVTSFAMSDSLPPGGGRGIPFASIQVQGRPSSEDRTGNMIMWQTITPGYFSTLGIPIRRGRGFREEDRQASEHSVVLNESLARSLFPNKNPVGKNIRFGADQPWSTVVGVAADVRNLGPLRQAEPGFYIPRKHALDDALNIQMRGANILIRSAANSNVVAKWLRSEVAAIDPTLPITVQTMNERIGKLAQRPRFNAMLLSLFAGMGVLLAAIGLYGVISFLVAQRTQEIGVRMALGATPGNIAKLVLSHAARWTIAGALLGLVGSLAATRLLVSMLFQVPARDPITLGAALVLLLIVALVAAWIPSRRAAKVDPMRALRQE